MTINWAGFTPWLSLAGGARTGLSAARFIVFYGRISGVIGDFFRQQQGVLVLARLSRRSLVGLFEVLMHLSSQKRDSASLARFNQ